jgi:soluble lytic murein transglycosylase-like protein
VNWASASTTSLSTRPDARGRVSFWGVTAGLLVLLVAPSTAFADLVTFRGGRILNVASVAYEGTEIVLTLRSGGQMRAPREFVVDVQPDEVPWPEPVPEPEPTPEAAPVVPDSPDGLRLLIDRMAAVHGVDVKLAHALVKVESNYRADAVSPKGAMGLMQLMPATARQYAIEDPFDPVQNLTAGLRHLRGLLDRYGRGKESLALAAYNAGEGAVRRYNGIPPYRETQNYVQRILSLTRK